jgi:hypothetical protein
VSLRDWKSHLRKLLTELELAGLPEVKPKPESISKPVSIPDVPESLLGFRVWRIVKLAPNFWKPGEPYLHSCQNVGNVWPINTPLKAQCRYVYYASDIIAMYLANPMDFDERTGRKIRERLRGHVAPQQDCTCGIYGAYNIDTVFEYATPFEQKVFGLAWGWGPDKGVVPTQRGVSQRGWRAKFARPAAIFSGGPALDTCEFEPDQFVPSNDTLRRIAQRYHVPLIVAPYTKAQDYLEGARNRFAQARWRSPY